MPLTLSNLRVPKQYVRSDVDANNVARLVELVKEEERSAKERKRELRWPFTTKLTLRPTGKGDEAEVLDGVHRMTALRKVRWSGPIEHTMDRTLDDGHAVLTQLTENRHGIAVRPADRDRAIRYMRNDASPKVPLRSISSALGLSEASVSRIADGKQSGHGTTKRKRAKSAGGRKTAKRASAFNAAEHFYAPLNDLVTVFGNETTRTEVLDGKGSVDPAMLASAHKMITAIVEHTPKLRAVGVTS
jgi:hypothetical protein